MLPSARREHRALHRRSSSSVRCGRSAGSPADDLTNEEPETALKARFDYRMPSAIARFRIIAGRTVYPFRWPRNVLTQPPSGFVSAKIANRIGPIVLALR
jgi:hypothetical protein